MRVLVYSRLGISISSMLLRCYILMFLDIEPVANENGGWHFIRSGPSSRDLLVGFSKLPTNFRKVTRYINVSKWGQLQ